VSVNGNFTNFRYRALTPGQAGAIRAAAKSGVRALLLAAEYGVSVRTIYRTLERSGCSVHLVRLDDWRAEFEMTDEGPVRVTSWLPA
jgi:DNA invertase Pin-like site-specific DNA recombinase